MWVMVSQLRALITIINVLISFIFSLEMGAYTRMYMYYERDAHQMGVSSFSREPRERRPFACACMHLHVVACKSYYGQPTN